MVTVPCPTRLGTGTVGQLSPNAFCRYRSAVANGLLANAEWSHVRYLHPTARTTRAVGDSVADGTDVHDDQQGGKEDERISRTTMKLSSIQKLSS